jgi:hypothetical protein
MNEVAAYLESAPPTRKSNLNDVIEYIRREYPDFELTCNFSPKTKFPVFKSPDGGNYVGVASQKAYIAIHFGRYYCPPVVAEADGRIKTGVGCAKIPDGVPFPLEHIKRAIDLCFAKTD